MAFLYLFQLQRFSLTLHEHRHLSLHQCDSPACVFWLTCQSTSFISCGSRCSCFYGIWVLCVLLEQSSWNYMVSGQGVEKWGSLHNQFKIHIAGFSAGYHWPLQWGYSHSPPPIFQNPWVPSYDSWHSMKWWLWKLFENSWVPYKVKVRIQNMAKKNPTHFWGNNSNLLQQQQQQKKQASLTMERTSKLNLSSNHCGTMDKSL